MVRTDEAEWIRCLEVADLDVVGRISDASNLALLVGFDGPTGPAHGIYKPIRGERPLWDFPDGTLAGREVAAWRVSSAGGWDVVPATVLRDGPLGPGSLQRWVTTIDEVTPGLPEPTDPYDPGDPDEPVVDVVAKGTVRPGWASVIEGIGSGGRAVVVIHELADDVRDVATLDAVINNSDRKGSHIVRAAGHIWGFDHGVSFHEEPKLRTVLWGWAGQRLRDLDLARLEVLVAELAPTGALSLELAQLLPERDVAALRARVHALLAGPTHPVPAGGWPAVPWPPL